MDLHRPLITTKDRDGVLVITVLDKQLNDVDQVEDWQRQMAEAIRRASPAGVVIDMQRVEYMTSVAMLPLIATRSLADELGAKIILCNLSDSVLQALTVTQLIVERREHVRHLAVAENLDAAILAVSRPK
jgi:anti-anti-sigma factor